MTATKTEPSPTLIDLDAHQADMARRKAEIDANHEEMLKCCNPAYARHRELQKPVWVWTLEVDWYRGTPKRGVINHYKKASVIAQSESDAWAKFCDKIGTWPSRRDAKVKFKRGKQVPADEVLSETADGAIPRVEFKAKLEDEWIVM